MRHHFRTAAFFAVAVGAITCTDSSNPTKPQATRPVRLSVSPKFSAEAAQAYSALAAGGIVVTEVHVHLAATDGSARDSVIDFPPSVSQLLVEIPVSAGQDGHPFTVLVELRNDSHTVLFSGTQTVVAHSSQFNGDTPPEIVLQYTGPGKGTATVTVSPANPTTSSLAAIPFTAAGADAGGHAVPDLLVLWTSSDPTVATVTSTGDATALVSGLGKRGVATITATTPLGVFGSSRLTFVPPAAKVVVISGGGQTGVAGTTLPQPLVVEVQASDNLPVPGAPVTFRAITAGGSVQQTNAIADASGRASTTLTLGPTAGVYQYEASSASLTAASVTATATPVPPAALTIVSGSGQSGVVGLVLPQPLVVRVTDQLGAPVSGASIAWTRLTGSGVLGATSSLSDVNGLSSIAYTLGGVVGTESVQASVAGVSGSAGTVVFTMTALNRTPVAIAIVSGGNQSGAPGAVLPTALVATVTDVGGNAVPNVSVTWSAVANGVTFAPATSTTNAAGQVSTTATLGTTAGPVVVTATAAGAVAATTTLTITGSTVQKFVVLAGPPASITVGAGIPNPVQVQVVDGNNSPILQAGINVTLDINVQPSNTNVHQSVITNASGIATFALPLYIGPTGSANFTVTVGSFSQVINTSPVPVFAGAATHLLIATQPSPTATSGTPLVVQPAIQFADAGNNILGQAGLSVTASIGSGGGTLGGTTTVPQGTNGTATFTNLSITGTSGTRTLTFTSGALPPITSSGITVGAASANKLTITTQPSPSAQAGVLFAVQPVIQLVDANGNPVAQANVNVVADIVNGGGSTSLTGSVSLNTDARGVATFTDLAIAGPIGTRTLQFSSGTLSPVVSGPIAVSAGPAAQLIIFTNTSSTAVSGVPLAPQPGIQVQDAFGDPILTAGTVVTASIQNGTGTLTNTTATTNASGVATFSGLTITGKAGVIDLRFDATGVSPVFLGIDVTPGALASIVVTPNPATINTGATQQFTAAGFDASNNAVSIAPTWSVANGGGTINAGGLFTAGTSAGTFSNTVKATSGLIVGTATVNVNAVVTTPTQLRIATQPAPAAQVGVALAPQPSIQLADVNGNPVALAGVNVTAVIAGGGGTLNGTTSINTNASGVATFTNLSITGTVGVRTLRFQSGTLSSVVSSAINITLGPGSELTFTTPPASSAGSGIALAPQPVLQLRDAGGNAVLTPGVVVTATIASGSGSLTNATATSGSNGSVTFGALTITGSAGPFVLQFAATGYTPLSSGTIALSAGANTLATKAGHRVSVDLAGTKQPTNAPIFVAKNAQGAPLSGQTVRVSSSGRCKLTDPQGNPAQLLNYISDANGEVLPIVILPLGAGGAGCVIQATGNAFTTAIDSALIAVYPAGATHIYVGTTSNDWSTAANWLAPGNVAVTAAPGAADQAFVPNYITIFNFVKLAGPTSVRRLAIDSFAVVNANQSTLTVGNLGVTGSPLGSVFNGTTNLGATASLVGSFDKLTIGQGASCTGFMGTLTQVVAISLDLFCAAKIDTTAVGVGTDLVVHPNGGALSLTSARAQLLVTGNAVFTGDSLFTVGGNMSVSGNATFGGAKVLVNGGLFNLFNNATFQAGQATYTNAVLSIGGFTSFGGGTTGVQLFSGGTLSLSGSFDQQPGSSPATFTTSNDHITQFTGAVTQSISFVNAQSFFSVLRLLNSSTGGVIILGSAQTINGTKQPRVDLASGKLTLNPNATLSAAGNVKLAPGATLNLLAGSNLQITPFVPGVSCTGQSNATITGPGTINGQAVTPTSCAP